jgi:hypothetical protein
MKDLSFLKGNLERTADGTLIAYIGFWRYSFFGAMYAVAFYVCIDAFFRLYHELPTGFYKHWDKNASITFFMLILGFAMVCWGYFMVKGGYKKVQFELTGHNVRYIKPGIRGGTMLSENEQFISLGSILDVQLRKNLLGGGVITVRTATQTHTILLLLSTEQLQVCYQALQEAIHKRQVERKSL